MADAPFVLPSDADPTPDAAPASNFVLPSDLDDQQAAAQPNASADGKGFSAGFADGALGLPTSDVVQGFGSGVVKGAAGLVGLPGDVQQMSNSLWDRAALWLGHKAFDATGYGPQAGTPDRAAFDKGFLGMDQGQNVPTSSDVLGGIESVGGKLPTPQTTAGKYAETVGEFVPGTLAGPEGLAKKVAYGAVAPGVGSEFLGQQTQGTPLEPYARGVGALLGVGTGALANEGARLAGKGLAKVGETFQPMTEGGQQQMAADQLASKVQDLDSTKAALASADNPQLVPGSQPTTFQLTGDMGLGSAEKVAETQDPVPFQQRRADQNAARVSAMTGIQPGGGAEDLASGLRSYLGRLDDMEAGNVNTATQTAQDAALGLGGQQSADFYGRQLQGAAQPQVDAAQQGLQGALDRIGGNTTPEASGAAMRGVLQNPADAARQQRSALYRAIDPDGTLNAVATGPKQVANNLVGGLSPMAAQPADEEASILGQMRQMPDVIPFRDLQALDTRITGAMSQESRTAGQTATWGRLSQLKGSVQDAISNGVANQVAYERHGIATGQIAPDNSIEARWIAERDAILANRAAETQSRAKTGTGDGAFGSRGTGSVSGPSGAQGQVRGGLGDTASPSGAPPDPLQPNVDQAAADRLAIAKQTHAEYARTFKQGPVGNILKTNGFQGQYQLVDSGVPNQVFQPGAKGAETLNSYLHAAGHDAQGEAAAQNTEQAVGAARNYAAMSLRRAAQNPDGTINLPQYRSWLTKHQDALRTLPNGQQDFGAIGPAQQALQRFSPFTEATAPSAIPEMFFHTGPSGADGVANLRDLVGDRVATPILTDYAASKLRAAALNSDGTLDPRKVQQFVKVHQPALDAMPGLADRFSSAARATETIAQAAAARKAATDTFQRDAVGKIIGSTEPSDITRMVGDVFAKRDAVAQMKDLAAKAQAAGPDAYQGLRKAVADHIVGRFMANGEAGTSGVNKIAANAFQTFARKNGPVLRQVFSEPEVNSLQAVADDITRANRSRDAINIPGQSATAQLQHHVAAAGQEPESWLETMFKSTFAGRELGEMAEGVPLVGAMLGHAAAPLAIGAAAGKHVIDSMRASGLKKVDDLYREALLNPSLAKELLQKVKPASHVRAPEAGLVTQIARLAPFYNAPSTQLSQTPARATGGRIDPTEAQKDAGNYPKDHVRFAGMDISIENRKGSERSGVGKDGRQWSVKMPADYGYIRGTVGADGDHVDCYLGPDETAPYAWIINQMHLHPRKFDEHKVMLGFRDRSEALRTYERGFSDGKGAQRIGSILCLPIGAFPKWAKSENATRRAA